MSTENPRPPQTTNGPSRPPILCPRCGGAAVPIGYGYPGPGMFEAAERGELVLGGCCIEVGQPTHTCRQCGEGFEART